MYCGGKEGELLECSLKGCELRSHTYCAFQYKMSFSNENVENTEGWTIDLKIFSQYEHSNNCRFNVSRNTSNAKFLEYLNITKKERIKASASLKFQSEQNKTSQSIMSIRGGGFKVYCASHKPQELYCICQQICDFNHFMIACDNCRI
jgi:hypothetical protein